MIALEQFTAHLIEHPELFLGLHALRERMDAEILRQAKKGETFKCIPSESDSDWFAIIYDDGNIAFVATTLAHVTAEMDELSSLTPVG